MEVKIKTKNLQKKIICVALIIIMLISNFITPITILAIEQDGSVTENAYTLNGENTTNTIPNASSEESIDEEPTIKTSNDESDNASNVENNKNENTSASSEEDKNSGGTDIQGKENENLESGKTDKNENSNILNEEDTTSKNNDNFALFGLDNNVNNSDSKTILDELKERIKPVTKDDITNGNVTVKTKNDNHEINQFSMQFVSGATKDENGNLVWTPENSAVGHEFAFRVNYAISGLKELPAEAIQITIPKSILRNREGNLDDYYIMSLPTSEEYDGTTEFAYIEDEDYIVVYNPDEVKAGINGYFEIAYATKSTTFNYKDYDTTNLGTVVNGGTASDPFNAIITVKSGEDILANVSDEENVYINTNAKITSTQKRYPTLYRTWNTSWMKETPTDSDEYYYLVWEIRTYIQKDPTQKYNFKLEDVVTDLTKGTNGQDYELVGYKLSGEKYYSDKNTQENLTRDEYRYDYVLTRHKISTYKDIEYTLKNTVTATVDPIDQVDNDTKATSSNTFYWDPAFTPPTGHFNLFKYGNNSWYDRFLTYWDYANYDLDKLQKEEVNELKGFKYFTETIGYAYPWTLKEGGSSDNPEDYGINPVTYDTWDDTLYLEGDANPINYSDYYLDYFTYNITNNDAQYQEGDNKFTTIAPTYKDNETITFYGKFNGGVDWVQIGTYNLETKEITPNNTYIEEMTTDKITFKEGVHCTGWRFTTSNTHYYTYITVTPYFVITNSDHVKEKIKDKDSIKLQNNVSTNITDYKGDTIFEKETSGIDYARVTYYDSDITKKVSSVSNNAVGKTYTITWKVNAWETATSGSGKAEYIWQNSGKFYDLIPLGGELDVSSIQVQTEAGFLEENEYTYEVIPNYNNSGRPMLVVNINVQAQYYTVYYKTVHSWDSIKDYGRNVLNPVAYETGNEKIANGYADNGGNLSSENKELFTDLDNTTDDKKFIYTEQTYNINAVTAAVSGLYKKVKNSKESEYSYNTEVEPNGSYTYQLRYQNTYINKSKNLVLFDSLENFEVKDTESGETKTSGWRGTLQSVDLTQLKKKGIDAVLYVSTIENLNLEEHNDITDKSIWTKATMFTDLSNVTAIAIDMTKDTWGNDYILETGESVTAVLHMKAPEDVTDEIEENPYTYNNVYIKNTLIDELEGTMDYFIHQDYTTVKYHIIADVPFYKVNAENESQTIKGITFRLYGTSRYGTEVDEYLTSDKNGFVNFKDIEAGEYILQEYEATPDWLEDHTEHTVEVTNTRKVYVDGELVTILKPATIKNTPRIHTDVTFTKRNLVNNFTIEGAKFKLEGTSNYGNEVLMYATSDNNGNVTFTDLEYGTYELIEIEVPEGYILSNDTYRVVVDENGNYDILLANTIIETRYAHTINFDDNGNRNSNGVYFGTDVNRTVTVKGAKKLHVELTYGCHTGWIAVYDGTVTPTNDNYAQSISGKLENWTYARAYDIEGDTVQFYFNTNGSENGPYGYHATITAYSDEYTSIYDNGKYNIYNEPLHSFRLIKRDSYSDKTIEGAKFKLHGTSDYGNTYNMEIASSSIGFVDFTGLESGTYILQETYVPEVTDEQGNTVSYILDENKYVVKIEKDGTVTINGIEKNENGNFVFYNKRNKGQITITKKWIDDSNNEERPEPVINISTEKPIESRFQYFRNNYNSVNGPLYYITNNSSYQTKITGSFARNTSLREDEVVNLGAVRIDKDYNDENAEYKIYGWIDEDGNCWWWSNAEVALMTNDSNRLFYNLRKATNINLTDINIDKVTKMDYMFDMCESLTELDVSNFDTSKVTTMGGMFSGCGGLTKLDVSNFDTSKVTNMGAMFSGCGGLIELDVSSFDTSKVTKMNNMFHGCGGLTELDVSKFNTSNVTSMYCMFNNCGGLIELDVSNFDTSKVTNMEFMFHGCGGLTELDVSGFDTSNVTSMASMFDSCDGLTELDVSGFDTSNVTNMRFMFSSCDGLTELDVNGFDTSKVTSMTYMFDSCDGLTELDVSGFDTSKVTSMDYMFNRCTNLIELDLSNFDTGKVMNIRNMFGYCSNLVTIYVSEKFVTENVTDSINMFWGCYAIRGGNGTTYKSDSITYARIDKDGQPGYFTYKAQETASININSKNTISTSMLYTELKNKIGTNDETIKISQTKVKESMPLFSSETIYNTGNENANTDSNILTYSTANTNYDDQGNEINWVKNGDTWTYTFYVDDPNATWYVWEEPLDGYSSNYTVYYPGKVENQEAIIINNKINGGPQAEDEKPTVGFGSLVISKTLLGVYDDGVRPITDDDTEFIFNVKLTAKTGYESFISGTKVFGDYIFKDGVGTVKVKAGEIVTISDLPLGTSFKVTEEVIPEYQVTGYYGFSDTGGSSGTVSNKTTTVYANNFKDERTNSTTPVEEEKTTSFTVAKKVIGNYEEEEDYSFEISLNNLKENTTYNLSNGTSFTSDSTGSANVSISLRNGESVAVQDIPVGSKYKVYEHAGDYISSYVIADNNNVGLINNSANNNTKVNKELSTATETADEGEDVIITFTNEKIVTQNLKLAKVVTDENDKNSYMFNIEFSNMKAKSSFNSSVGKITADANGKANVTVYLAGGDETEFYDVPVGTTYKITELASTSIASYTITDKNGTGKIVSESGASTNSKTALSTKEETINEGEEATVTFINDTINQEPDSVSASLGVTKNVLNIKGETLENCKDAFAFEITPDDETNPMPENNTITITGNGEENFGTITFTKTGTYSYKVTEIAGDLDYYNYDDSVYTIVYDVTNTEGLLEVTKTVKKNGFSSDTVVFTNRISRADVKVLKIDEEGNPLSRATLQVLDSEGNVVKEWITGENKTEENDEEHSEATNIVEYILKLKSEIDILEENNVNQGETTSKGTYTLKLVPGAYTLHEVDAPEGYEVANDITFVVNEDGTVSVNDELIDEVTMIDLKVKEEKPEKPEDPETPENPDNPDKDDNKEENPDDPDEGDNKDEEPNKPDKDGNNKEETNNPNDEDNKADTTNNDTKIEAEHKNLKTGDKIVIYTSIFILAGALLAIAVKKKINKE